MQTRTQATLIRKPRFEWTFRGLVERIIERDRLFRERRALETAPEERLRDMGMTRSDAARAHARHR